MLTDAAAPTEPLRNFSAGDTVEVQGIRFEVAGIAANGIVIADRMTGERYLMGYDVQAVRV